MPSPSSVKSSCVVARVRALRPRHTLASDAARARGTDGAVQPYILPPSEPSLAESGEPGRGDRGDPLVSSSAAASGAVSKSIDAARSSIHAWAFSLRVARAVFPPFCRDPTGLSIAAVFRARRAPLRTLSLTFLCAALLSARSSDAE